jgi:hypothetical protein
MVIRAPPANGPVVFLDDGSLFDIKDGQLVPHAITMTDLPAWPRNMAVPELPTPAEAREDMGLFGQLDEPAEAALDAQLDSMHDLSPREKTILSTSEAKRILATRPSMQPAPRPAGAGPQATPAEMSELVSLILRLDPSAQRDLVVEGETKTNLSPREFNSWRIDEAKRMATTRPATPPAATP